MRSGSTGSAAEMVDSNVFVYAADPAAGERHERSLALLDRLNEEGSLVVSVQVLNEVYSASTRPNRPPSLSHEAASALIEKIAASAIVIPLHLSTVLLALKGAARYQLPIWDALIWAAAREGGVEIIHTEDLPGQPTIEGVRYSNPFAGCA